jgi:hypothetical protein
VNIELKTKHIRTHHNQTCTDDGSKLSRQPHGCRNMIISKPSQTNRYYTYQYIIQEDEYKGTDIRGVSIIQILYAFKTP